MKHILILLLLAIVSMPCAAQWINAGYDPYPIIAFGVHDTTLFLSAPGHLYRYPGGGEADGGIAFMQGNVTSFASLGTSFYAGVANGQVDRDYETTNNGTNWSGMDIGSPIATNGRYLFGGYGRTSIALSRDGGNTWDSITNLPLSSLVAMGIYIFVNTGNAIWLSKDTGNHWSQLSPPFTGTMTTMGTLLFITGSNRNVIESSDSGMHWDTITVDTAGEQEYVAMLATDGKNLFASASGVLLSTDTGKTWRAVNTGFPVSFYPLDVTAMGVFDTLLFADIYATNGFTYNLYMRSIPEMLKDTTKSVVQTAIAGDSIAIYPNPAMGTVTILAGGTPLLGVSVLNVLGEETGPEFRGPGSGDVSLDVSKLPSGTYFLRIESANGSALRKVVIQH